MNQQLVIQLHVHSDRSFDSKVTIDQYIQFLEDNLKDNEHAILGITDHNVLPLRCTEALEFSTERVFVVPGIQWRLHKTLFQSFSKLCTRREIITVGPHDDLELFLKSKFDIEISNSGEISRHISEDELLRYLSGNKEAALIIPHPRHFFFEFYGKKEIKDIYKKLVSSGVNSMFFVEEKTGYDPFPRILYSYRGKYPVLGGSDAHEIYSFLGTKSILSVETTIQCGNDLISLLKKSVHEQNINLYLESIRLIFLLVKEQNDKIRINKNYAQSTLQFLRSIPLWFIRRFENFPRTFLK